MYIHIDYYWCYIYKSFYSILSAFSHSLTVSREAHKILFGLQNKLIFLCFAFKFSCLTSYSYLAVDINKSLYI